MKSGGTWMKYWCWSSDNPGGRLMRRLGLIGGTGLDHFGPPAKSHDIGTSFGQPSAAVAEYHVGKSKVFFLPRHGERHQLPPHAVNYRANVDSFRQLEVEGIIAVNAVGGISDPYPPGRVCLPDQLIDYTWGRAHTFSMGPGDELLHIEFAGPFDGHLRTGLLKAAAMAEIHVVDGGCIGVSQGPRLETAAEIRRFRQDGCDLVGMTSMPEAALAREAGLDYASLCVTANWAAGLEQEPVTMAAIEATLALAMVDVHKILGQFFAE
jgi:5'-methylthioinosine phosphorylase